MTFASQLRTADETISVGETAGNGERITVRVQMAEVWDVVRFEAGNLTAVSALKETALRRLLSGAGSPAAFMVKLNGLEILDESIGIGAAGAKNGSTFLLTFRRRRPVR